MNAVEIEEVISELADASFDPNEFPINFLRAFGNKETTIKKLMKGTTNKSDLGGVFANRLPEHEAINYIHLSLNSSVEI